MVSVSIISHQKHRLEILLSQLQGKAGIQAIGQDVEYVDMLPLQLEGLQSEVILLDADLLVTQDGKLVAMLKQKSPQTKVILFVEENHNNLLEELSDLHISIDGILSVNALPPVCLKAIQAVTVGEFWLPRHMIAKAYRRLLQKANNQLPAELPKIAEEPLLSMLTEREKQVSRLIAKGLANKEIAREMDLSINTVKKYIKNIYIKCGVRRRSQIASLFYPPAF